jgi:hypothetical protein
MKSLSIAALVAVAGFTALPTLAMADTTIHGYEESSLEYALDARGVATERVEEWGSYVRAWVPNGAGGTDMRLFDPDTLQQVSPFRG